MSLFRREVSGPAPFVGDDVRAWRIKAARKCHAWTELDPAMLVTRERGFLVHSESDEAFTAYRGDAFSPGGMIVADQTPLYFFVTDDVHVLEKQSEPWSAIVYQRERRAAR